VFENRVLRRIFGPTLVELTKYSRRQYKDDHNTFYVHALFTQVIRSRRMRWLGHWHEWEGGCMKGTYRVLVGKSDGRDPLEDPYIDGRIVLKWIFGKWDVEHELD
jgi:hypothetical protein